MLGIEKTRTTTMNPMSNGFIEHVNRSLCDMLNCLVLENPFSWDALIRLCMLAYNTNVHESTQETPSMMMFGRQCILPTDLMNPLILTDSTSRTVSCEHEFVRELQSRMHDIHRLARENIKDAALKQSKQYNNRLKLNNYEPGDQVYYFNPVKDKHTAKENYFKWKGPFTVVTKLCDTLYRIQLNSKSKSFVVHHNKLKLAHNREVVDTSWIKTTTPPVEETINDVVTNGVERPVRKRRMPQLYGDWYYK